MSARTVHAAPTTCRALVWGFKATLIYIDFLLNLLLFSMEAYRTKLAPSQSRTCMRQYEEYDEHTTNVMHVWSSSKAQNGTEITDCKQQALRG
jgi:hypothetical protein